jgi:hypothetical protein
MEKTKQQVSKITSTLLTTNIINESINDNVIESKYYIKTQDKPKQEIMKENRRYKPYGKE